MRNYNQIRLPTINNNFIELNDRINEVIYHECNEFELWKGYRLSAIDGSVLEIPDTEMLRNEFGYVENQNYKIARAKAACIYDVINKIVIKSTIDKYCTWISKTA